MNVALTSGATTPPTRWQQYSDRAGGRAGGSRRPLGNAVALLIIAALWAAPTLVRLVKSGWDGGQGAQLAIIVPTAIWVASREWPRGQSFAAGRASIAALIIGVAALLNLASWFAGFLLAEVLSVYMAGIGLIYAFGGRALLRRLWFPLVYGLAALPLPTSVMGAATRELKLLVADASIRILAALGYEVARTGTSIFIDQYELVIEAACSGLNSIVSLVAVGLLYGYLRHRAQPWRILALVVAAVAFAIVANIVRVVLLGALVARYGVYLLDTPIHGATGLLMFAIAAVLLMMADAAISAGGRTMRWLFLPDRVSAERGQ